MIHATRRGIVVLILALGFVGCGGSTTPTMPTPVHQPTDILSGLAFLETPTALVPLPGVRVEETNSHRSATSDKEGRYSLPGLYAASNSVSANRWDTVVYTTTLTITGDTQLDIALPTHTLSGVVFERTPTGTAPIAAVEVYCDGCGSPYGHTFTYTDAKGFYSFCTRIQARIPSWSGKRDTPIPPGFQSHRSQVICPGRPWSAATPSSASNSPGAEFLGVPRELQSARDWFDLRLQR